MTATTDRPTGSPQRPRMRPPESLPTRTRLRGQIIAGLLLVVVSALLGALIFLNAGDREAVLAVRDGVPAGHELGRADLVSKSVAGVDGAIVVENLEQVIGKTTAVGLVAGQLLDEQMLSDDPVPANGQAMAGLALTPDRMPGDGLEAGDVVRVVGVPSADAATEDLAGSASVLVESAVVYSIREEVAGEASTVVTVVVPSAAATSVAVHSAAGRVAIVKTALPGGGG